ncbi:MAG TPA: LpqB family beta-propeller domain-containing protein [Actinocrinis sp.]|jgi:dipeptidyl aminopeptidase/acylaminoacyl peptidase
MTALEDAAGGAFAIRRHGDWISPITPAAVAADAGGPSWPSVVGPETWWCTSQTTTTTIRLLRCAAPGEPARDVLGGAWKVANGAIGYGGRPYLAVAGGERHLLVFTNSPDRRLYAVRVRPRLSAGEGAPDDPIPLTPADPDDIETCYADPVLGPDGSEVWCIRETARVAADEASDSDAAPVTARDIVAVPLSGAAAADPGAIRVVARSHDFLSGVRVSPDGARLAWIGWNHPDMPWDSSELMVARLAGGRAAEPVRVLGGEGLSVPQAEWAGPDTLYAMADPDGWWNLHRVALGPDLPGGAEVECVLPTDSDCSHPIWRVGTTTFAVTGSGVVFRQDLGDQRLALWDPRTGEVADLAAPWTQFSIGLHGDGQGDDAAVAVIAASATERPTPLRVSVADRRAARCIPRTADPFEPWHAIPERRSVAGRDGREVHFTYCPPRSPDHRGPRDEPPPLIIDVHGGPTSATGAERTPVFSLLCSRGFAVASVDYGGSTGYGRAYRDLLRHAWGIVDVEDCVTVARALADSGLADPRRTAIRGGSAGGWTALAALGQTNAFCCAAVYYPITDPLTWSGAQTHDFESRYIRTLVGELPQDEEHYRRVSPLANAGRITAPFVMLQGLDDRICRPDQARRVVQAVEAARGPGLCRAFLLFPGEGHGFRRAESITAGLEAELALYREVMLPD